MQEKSHNQRIHTNLEKEITTSFPRLGVHVLKCYPHQKARNQEGTNYARRIQHVIKMTYSQECSLLRVDSVQKFCHHTMSTKSTINDTTYSFGIIKKRKKANKNTLLVFHVSYTVLFLTLNILRLSAMYRMGHKPIFGDLLYCHHQGQCSKKPQVTDIYCLKISLFITA